MKITTLCLILASASQIYSQPNPYRPLDQWAKLPEGRKWGSASAIDIDRKTGNIWVVDRCAAATCGASKLDPIFEFDASGKMLKNFGGGMFVTPHGMYIDKDGNLWIVDQAIKDGKGFQVFKLNQDGKVLLTLGKAGVAGTTNDTFNSPSDVIVAPNGDIFVADGHGGNTNARIVKFDKDGKFIKTWGQKGSGPGDLDIPHTIAMDSQGRLFVGDRQNNRIQIFDQDGKFLDQWTQFSRPSGIYIDAKDNIYVADSESESVSKNHDGWKRGIRVGSARDGLVTAFIPDPVEKSNTTSAAEGVAADAAGNIYGAEVGPKRMMKYVRQ